MILVREKSFYKNLVTLALPIMFQNVISFGINFADNVMVGKLGDKAIAGVYLGGQIQLFLSLLLLGIEGSIMVPATQYWGRRDQKSIRDIIAIGVRFALVFGIIFCIGSFLFTDSILRLFTSDETVIAEGAKFLKVAAFSFLFFSISQSLISSMRSVEMVSIGFYISVISLIIDVFFNYVFIYGNFGAPALGAAGSALATLISRVGEATAMIIYVFKIDRRVRVKFDDFFHINTVLLKDFIRYGAPIIAGQVVWSVNNLTQSWIIGNISPEALAAVSVSNNLFSLANIGMAGFSSAIGIMTGKTVGAGNFDLMKLYAKTVQVFMLALGVFCGIIIFACRSLFISMYNLGPETIRLTGQFLDVLAVMIVGTTYQAGCLAGLVKAGGDTAFVFKNDTIFVFLVVLPSALIALFVFHSSAWIVFACMKCDQILKCFVAVVKINRFKWMKNLTRAPQG